VAQGSRLSVIELLLIAVVVFFPVNYVLGAGLRPSDLVMLVLIFFCLPRVRAHLTVSFYLGLAFFALYGVSAVYGLLVFGMVKDSNLMFLYKYAAAFLLFWVLMNVRLSPRGVHAISRILFLVYFALVAYTFLYVAMWWTGRLMGMNSRVSFPLSNQPDPSGGGDAHLYAVVLSTCLVGYLFYPRAKTWRTRAFTAGVFVLTMAAIVLSGSRTGLLSIVLTCMIYAGRRAYTALVSARLRVRVASLLVALLIIAAAVGVFVRVRGLESEALATLTSRAFSFDPQGDGSIQSRIIKTAYALETVFFGPIFIGIGMQSTEHTWFDVGYASILVTAGLLGLVSVLACILSFLHRQKALARRTSAVQAYRGLEYLFINALVCAMSSEFYLVTRGLLPFAVLCTLYVQQIRTGRAAGAAVAAMPGQASLLAETGAS